jgi:oxygen-independent coproporphyrinogen-3 oxidase
VAPAKLRDTYVADLVREFELLAPVATRPLRTVFFGGGTPSLLEARQLEQVLAALHRTFRVDAAAEITMEANPGTLDAEKLAVLREYGVNRLSLGAQTFDDRLLMAIGRIHDAQAVRDSVRMAQTYGFARINIDLMFGLPEQTMEDVRRALVEVIALGAEHVSAYWLKVEPGTPFARWQDQGLLPLPGEDAEADMYDLVRETLDAAGYRQYEVSNFARPGGEARHNLVYWRNEPYLAAGVAAHGYVAGERYANVPALHVYHERLARLERPVAERQRVTPREACEDTMMLGLRLAEGVSDARFRSRHGVSMWEVFGDVMERLIAQGLLERTTEGVRLTERAWSIANLVFEQFVATDDTD